MLKQLLVLLASIVSLSSCSTLRTYTSLDSALENPNAVERLKISYKNLHSLPPEIARLKNLKELIFFRDNLDSLPDAIGEFLNLEKLSVTSCRLEKIPATIGKLSKLRILY